MDSPTESDTGLLRAYVGDSDLDAYDRLVDRHQQRLLGLATAFIGDLHAAQDAVQEAFIRLAERADQLLHRPLPGGSLRPWLAQVVRNGCIDRLRRERRLIAGGTIVEQQAEDDDAAEGPGAEVDDDDLGALLWDCVESLAPMQKAAVVLRYRDGRSYQEIAEELGKTVNHIGVLLNRALGRLRQNDRLRAEVLP